MKILPTALIFAAAPLAAISVQAPAQTISVQQVASQQVASQKVAQQGVTPSAAPVQRDSASPRVSIQRFLVIARRGDFREAARWLDPRAPEVDTRGAQLAQRLSAVLDSHLAIDLDKLSPAAAGDTTDGLDRDREKIGDVPDRDGRDHPIYLARRAAGSDPLWVFSAATVEITDRLYAQLPDSWIRGYLPRPLLGPGPFGLLWWQWLGLLTVILLSALIGWLLAGPTQRVLKRLVARTKGDFDDALVASARGSLMLLWGIAASRILLEWVALGPQALGFIVELQRAIVIVAVFWIFLRAIGVLQNTLPQSEWATRHPSMRTLIPFGGRLARVVVGAIGVLTVVATFGYPVATILAGLGIGGIAVALGAQKSLEHFFGSVSIGVDQPFRVGDWVAVAGVTGNIEEIGLRSTRIRTQARTLVSIPNGVLAEAQSENFGERDRIVLKAVIRMEYGLKRATLLTIRDEIRALMLAHPQIWNKQAIVRLINFGESSLDIEMVGWIATTNADAFSEVREEIFLGVMEIVERNGGSFAFPTRTVRVKRES
ncbi:MAG TPA: mechanosensitive ion channel family protein [Gemmatimonadaceae bacterium]|nr:mechanosensitive ion channel family protein [Gemmatimonadaceae bacterium]